MKTLPLKYKNISPKERYLLQSENPPNIQIEFYENIKNLSQINCYSNEGNKWRNSNLKFTRKNFLEINISEKFVGERGRVNCSLNDVGNWRWFGLQFSIKSN